MDCAELWFEVLDTLEYCVGDKNVVKEFKVIRERVMIAFKGRVHMKNQEVFEIALKIDILR